MTPLDRSGESLRRQDGDRQSEATDIDSQTPYWYGDELSESQEEATLLLGFLNINGLKTDNWKEKIPKYSISYEGFTLTL